MTLIAIISLILLVFLRINLVVFKRYCTALRRILLVFFFCICVFCGNFTMFRLNLATFSVLLSFFQVIFADLYMFVTQSNTRI